MVIWTISQAYLDFEHINKGEFIKSHASRLSTRVLVGVLLLILSPIAGVVLGLVFWALFDASLNTLRKDPLFHLGNTDNTDKFFRKYQGLYIVSKIISLVGSIFLTLVYGF